MQKIFAVVSGVLLSFGCATAADAPSAGKGNLFIDVHMPGKSVSVVAVPFDYKKDTFAVAIPVLKQKLKLDNHDEITLDLLERGSSLSRPVDLNARWDVRLNNGLPWVRATVKKNINLGLIVGRDPWTKL